MRLESGNMAVELFRLLLGVAIAVFHRPIAATILAQDRELYFLLRSRGLRVPAPLSDSTAYNLFFAIGILIALAQVARIWLFL